LTRHIPRALGGLTKAARAPVAAAQHAAGARVSHSKLVHRAAKGFHLVSRVKRFGLRAFALWRTVHFGF
jgi:hypothetical protein